MFYPGTRGILGQGHGMPHKSMHLSPICGPSSFLPVSLQDTPVVSTKCHVPGTWAVPSKLGQLSSEFFLYVFEKNNLMGGNLEMLTSREFIRQKNTGFKTQFLLVCLSTVQSNLRMALYQGNVKINDRTFEVFLFL